MVEAASLVGIGQRLFELQQPLRGVVARRRIRVPGPRSFAEEDPRILMFQAAFEELELFLFDAFFPLVGIRTLPLHIGVMSS